MAQRTLTVRKIREILRMKWTLGLSDRQVSASLKIAHSTVGEYLKRAEQAGLDWEQAQGLEEADLKAKLFPPKSPGSKQRPEPNWEQIEKELKQKGVTRMLLWEEYLAEHPDGYGYSQFCERFRRWAEVQETPTMRKPKKAGEEAEVDYAGLTMPVIDPHTGEITQAEIFVGVLGASGLIYAEAQADQSKPNWVRGHVRMFEFFGGVPRIVRPDNLKSGVSKASFYEPDLNPTYHELSVHYGTAVIPTRAGEPKDKALGENAVQQVERWVLAPLRKMRFFSVEELNQAMRPRLDWLNDRPLTGQAHSRRDLFEEIEKAALQPLPDYPFEYLEVKQAKVHLDYHVSFEKHHYSVPHQYTRKTVLVRASERLVEIYAEGKRIACHKRCRHRGYSTQTEHMPANHRWYLEWSPERFIKWGRQIGPQTEAFIQATLASRRHPEQAYRSCLGVLKLADSASPQLLEAACGLALAHDALSYKAVKRLLKTKRDVLEASSTPEPVVHEHIRGQNYYN
ncbi:MAG: IS21 family transposase [Chloroflexota bacterium]